MGALIGRLAVPLFVKLALLGGAALLAVIGWQVVQLAEARQHLAEAVAAKEQLNRQWETERRVSTQVALAETERNRKAEQELRDQLDKEKVNAEKERRDRAAADARADALNAGLREQVRRYARALAAAPSGSASGPGAAASCRGNDAAVAELGDVLAEGVGVVGEGQKAVGALTAQVNQLRTYAQACYAAQAASGAGR